MTTKEKSRESRMKRFAQRIFLACAIIWLPATAQAQPFPMVVAFLLT